MTDLVSEALGGLRRMGWYPEAKRLCAVFGSYSYGQGKLLATDANAKSGLRRLLWFKEARMLFGGTMQSLEAGAPAFRS